MNRKIINITRTSKSLRNLIHGAWPRIHSAHTLSLPQIIQLYEGFSIEEVFLLFFFTPERTELLKDMYAKMKRHEDHCFEFGRDVNRFFELQDDHIK
ncbi:MAG: hypothetical protein AABZ14_06225, partial [Candidatus Margulisiibacteriota bacterium]